MNHNKDISIGENQWINWVEFDAINANPININELLKPTFAFWKSLEIECVAACCGIDAFSFWPEDIISASENFDKEWLMQKFNELRNEVVKMNNSVIVSTDLNQLIDRTVFIKLLDHILESINSGKITTAPNTN